MLVSDRPKISSHSRNTIFETKVINVFFVIDVQLLELLSKRHRFLTFSRHEGFYITEMLRNCMMQTQKNFGC